jgi:peptidoglycan/xylan/chitin deacetylase (PgdA/CDA1 family)
MRQASEWILAVLLAGVAGSAEPVPKLTVARWPRDRQAAISLTFDDGMATHLDIAAPILKKHSLAGTFFVTTGGKGWRTRGEEWRGLAAEGHEIGGHTVRHPCLLERITPHAQDYTAEMMEADIREGAREIAARIPSRRGLTFAYPCGNMSFGPPGAQRVNQALYLRYVAEHFFAARNYGWSGTVAPDALSVLTVPDLGLTVGRGFPELLAMAQPALRDGQWGVFSFHGIGGEYLLVTAEAFDELAAYLARHPEIWTATFGDVVRYIQESKALGIRTTKSAQARQEFALNWPLDPQIFDLPLTLRFELPAGWSACAIEADGKAIPSKLSGRLALFEITPQTKGLRISGK